jgi:hypothetical protein
LTPSTLRGHKIFNFISFLTIFNALYVPIRGVQILFRHKNNGTLPLNLACLKHLNVIIVTQFATNEQLKDLTHMFCFWIPCYKLYKESLFFYVLTLKYTCHFGMNFKKVNLMAKHKIQNKISWLFLNALNFVLSYLLTYLGK